MVEQETSFPESSSSPSVLPYSRREELARPPPPPETFYTSVMPSEFAKPPNTPQF